MKPSYYFNDLEITPIEKITQRYDSKKEKHFDFEQNCLLIEGYKAGALSCLTYLALYLSEIKLIIRFIANFQRMVNMCPRHSPAPRVRIAQI